eukprot:4562224-Alexandrium_andersonii.AAC.1
MLNQRHGPAMVIGHEGRSAVYLGYRGGATKCAPEAARRVSAMEQLTAEDWGDALCELLRAVDGKPPPPQAAEVLRPRDRPPADPRAVDLLPIVAPPVPVAPQPSVETQAVEPAPLVGIEPAAPPEI